MTEHIYEGLFILDPEQYNRNPEEVSGQIVKAIESFGGTIRVSRLWEERRLTYTIKGHKRGTYWLTYFRFDTAKIKDLHRQFQLTGEILRFLLINIDPRLEELLVAHALAGPAKSEVTEDEAAPAIENDVFDEDDAEDEAADTEEVKD